MFDNVWFYILLYVVTGVIAVVADAKCYEKMRMKIERVGLTALCEFEDKALISYDSKKKAYVYMVIAFVLWPLSLIKATVRRIIVYKKIMKEELEKEEMIKRWLAG